MKTRKRLLSILLSLVLVLGLVPGMSLTAYADDTPTYTVTFSANGKTKTFENITLSHTFRASNTYGTSGSAELDQIIKTLYNPSKVACCNPNQAPTANGGEGKVEAGKNGSNHYITINGAFNGTATVTGNYWYNSGGGFDYSLDITCKQSIGVSLEPATAQTIKIGDIVAFTASVSPEDATDKKVKWSASGTDGAAVKLYKDAACTEEVGTGATETLTVYAKGMSVGDATVTVTSNANSNKFATCAVTVRDVPETGDGADFGLWAVMLALGLAGMGLALTMGKRRKARQ
ncbi:MAG: Ig-like domain-containing protein [Clostridia bacterium]|nr:Ig-like domain-containing protein [Clostridia bacterium]